MSNENTSRKTIVFFIFSHTPFYSVVISIVGKLKTNHKFEKTHRSSFRALQYVSQRDRSEDAGTEPDGGELIL